MEQLFDAAYEIGECSCPQNTAMKPITDDDRQKFGLLQVG
jgi:hypothetical protein